MPAIRSRSPSPSTSPSATDQVLCAAPTTTPKAAVELLVGVIGDESLVDAFQLVRGEWEERSGGGKLTARGKTIIDHTPMGKYGDPSDLLGALLCLRRDRQLRLYPGLRDDVGSQLSSVHSWT